MAKGQGHGVEVRLAGRQADLLRRLRSGEESLDDWDNEELLRGYRRSKKGDFRGRPPSVVPREVHEELAKRVKNSVAHELLGVVDEHVKPIIEKIAKASFIPADEVPGMKLQAQVAQDLLDRFVVTKQEKIEISGTTRHEEVIHHVTVDRDIPLDDDDEDIVDAEIVDDELEDEEEFEFDD